MQDLIKRLEAAEEGSRELDARIHAVLADPPIMTDGGGFRRERPPKYEPLSVLVKLWSESDESDWDGLAMSAAAPHYTTNLQDAVGAIPEGFVFSVEKTLYTDNGWSARCWRFAPKPEDEGLRMVGIAKSPALALCIAILKTLE